MNLRFWQWRNNARIRREENDRDRELRFMKALQETLSHTQIGWSGNMHVTHAQRPPAPRPMRITVCYVMPDGSQYRQYIPLNGQAFWVESFPHFWNNQMPDRVEFNLGYNDGSMV